MAYARTLTARNGGIESVSLRNNLTPYSGASTEGSKSLEAFPDIGWKIAYNNSDWAAVYQNLRKERRWWGVIAQVMEKTGATVRDRGMMYKAVA